MKNSWFQSNTTLDVRPTAKRRTFTSEYKLHILAEVDGCREPGAIGVLLRREGLYSSRLMEWWRQQASGELLNVVNFPLVCFVCSQSRFGALA